jgi:hypothetical protein
MHTALADSSVIAATAELAMSGPAGAGGNRADAAGRRDPDPRPARPGRRRGRGIAGRRPGAPCTARKPGLAGNKSERCRCFICTEAGRVYEARRRRLIAYGRWDPFVDAEPAQQHIAALRAAGVGTRRIAELASLTPACIGMIVWGAGGHRRTKIRPGTATAILAIPLHESALAGNALVDGTGTRRRLQALHRSGWSMSELGEQLGCTRANIGYLIHSTRPVQVATRRTINELYEHLSGKQPEPCPAATRARNYATKQGWAPPLAWDDDTIDDPSAQPNYGDPHADLVDEVLVARVLDGHPASLSPANRVAAVRLGRRRRLKLSAIGRRLRVSGTTIQQLAARAAGEAADLPAAHEDPAPDCPAAPAPGRRTRLL